MAKTNILVWTKTSSEDEDERRLQDVFKSSSSRRMFAGKLVFIGSNQKKFNFNIFRMPLNFLSAIYNGEISLKEAEMSQRNLEQKIEELKFNYRSKHTEEKERNKWSIDASK